MSNDLRGSEITGVYVDEAAHIDPRDYDRCRTCGVWKLIHNRAVSTLFLKDSCDDYLPTDNLAYLELMEDRAALRKMYETPMEG